MPMFVSSSVTLRRTLVAAALLAAAPALAQAPAAAPEAGAAGPKPGRTISATGRVMPPPRGLAASAPVKPASEAEMIKAQKAAEARSKAWDSKMQRTMSSICHGC